MNEIAIEAAVATIQKLFPEEFERQYKIAQRRADIRARWEEQPGNVLNPNT